jgi:hypothetical protein
MQAAFYTMFLMAMLGLMLEIRHNSLSATLRRNKGKYSTAPRFNRIWIYIDYIPTSETIPVTVQQTDAKKLASDIEVITDGCITAESWHGYTYRQILATLTPDQIKDIKSYRSFLT